MAGSDVEDVFGIVGTTQGGNFHVERVVAEGGYGVVYRAQHSGFRAPVALKCLKIPEQMSARQREVFLEKFREEAELMFRLSASIPEVTRPLHIDQLHAAGRFVPFLALEWLEGESLDGIISRRKKSGQAPMNLHKLVKLLKPVANALARAHRFPGPSGTISVVHRDLKPENIFVTQIAGIEGVKILDFGIAKAKKLAAVAAVRVTGRAVEDDYNAFTPAYGAPEQWAPKKYGESGTWTDVWGLALTMVEALVGEPVIDGEAFVMRAQVLDEKKRPTPRQFGVVTSEEVDKVFEKAMATDPRKRYQSVDDFWVDLEKAMGIGQPRSRDLRRELDDDDAADSSIRRPGSMPPSDPSRPRASLAKEAVASSASKSGNDFPISPRLAAALPGLDNPFSTSLPRATPSRGLPAANPASALAMDLEADLPTSGSTAPTSGPTLTASASASSSGTFQKPPIPPALGDDVPSLDLDLDLDRSPSSVRGSSQARPQGDARRGVLPSPPVSSGVTSRVPSSPKMPAVAPAPTTLVSASEKRPQAGSAPQPAAIYAARAPLPSTHRESTELGHLRKRLRGPLAVVLVALAISIVDLMVTRSTGQLLMIGPLRPFWIAGALALAGVGLIVWRLLGERDDV